ncbi:MAG: 50S ribosomal protein L29 [Lentisphaerae bacterium]|jgi:large subunit ribosomal protein L29|nr:50S ribosomal protein L29 [Lentisphaerota bacterium]
MKAQEIRDMSAEEQVHQLAETQKELFNLRMQQAAGQLEKPDRIRLLRRDIARLKTILNTATAAR